MDSDYLTDKAFQTVRPSYFLFKGPNTGPSVNCLVQLVGTTWSLKC